MLREYENAISHFKKAIEIASGDAQIYWVLSDLASIYATCTNDELRNGPESLRLADKACKLTEYKDSFSLIVLAEAYAECGNFQKAVECQAQAIALLSGRNYSGIGIQISSADGVHRVGSITPDTPAASAGIQVGDTIMGVDGQSVEDLRIEDLGAKIMGPSGTEVVLSMKRQGQEAIENISMVRHRITDPTLAEYEQRLAAYKAGKPWREKKDSDSVQSVQP